MFPTYDPAAGSSIAGTQPEGANSSPDNRHDDTLPPDDNRKRLLHRVRRMRLILGQVAGELSVEDDYLRQPGKHAHPSAQMDAAMGEISSLEQDIALGASRLMGAQDAAGLDEFKDARSVLGQAGYYDPTIADIRVMEDDPNVTGPDLPAAGMVHESGIMNLTAEHQLLVPPNLVAGEKIIEGLEHALSHAHATLVHKPSAAAKLRDAVHRPDDDEDEDDLERVLAPHGAALDGIVP